MNLEKSQNLDDIDYRTEGANLILITFDQLRGDWGNQIQPVLNLPNLNQLAANGWSAQRCYTSSPQCVPARLSWLTGLQPSRMGITKNQPARLPGNAPSFVRDLLNVGWTTAIVGKTHWSDHSKKYNLDKNKALLEKLGFEYSDEIAGPRALQKIECSIVSDWKNEGFYEKQIDDLRKRYAYGRSKPSWEVRESILPNHLYPDIWIADRAIKMLDQMPLTKPWLLWISFVGPHEPFDTPRPWKGINKACNMPKIALEGLSS